MTENFKARYVQARKSVIERRYFRLNPPQRKAVLATEGPTLLLAGAGSGKTTVLINRIDNLLTFGKGGDTDYVPDWVTEDELSFLEDFPCEPTVEDWREARRLCAVEPAAPWSVIAITFTNKAAGELQERLERMCGSAAKDIWAATFHSACLRILRREIEGMDWGFTSGFTVYDTDDTRRVLRDIQKELNLEEKEFPYRYVSAILSNAKNQDKSPEQFAAESLKSTDWRQSRIAGIYKQYVQQLREANALDFDDIILYTVHLLRENQKVREYYQQKFRYVLIDEYQDTNHLQYLLARLLAGERENICVVGDDDQSIYRFRGATIENILNFEEQYPSCRTIRLEQNYRSTQNILEAANGVIRHNTGRKGKTLWTQSGQGEKVQVRTLYSETEEADFIAGKILENSQKGASWRENAVLYRMNAQSNAIEMSLRRNGIPYKVYGGMKFFDRAEVKDMLSYLSVLHNHADDLRLRRIVNVPLRGIGNSTIDKLQAMAVQEGTSLWQMMEDVENRPVVKTTALKIREFLQMMKELEEAEGTMELPDFYDLVCEKTGYIRALEEKNDMESRGRIENVRELRSSMVGFLETGPDDPGLSGFLDSVALYTDLDTANPDDDCVSLMTIHSAKGLEFPMVYVVGMEEGIFPGMRAAGDMEEMEEERRLCYVAMTRAREQLTMTTVRQRMLYGRTNSNLPSRFIEEIPEDTVSWEGKTSAAKKPYEGAAPGLGGSVFSQEPRNARSYATGREVKNVALSSNAGFTPKAKEMQGLNYQKGDRIRHKTFGEGQILSIRPMGNDALLEISFQKLGTKRLMLRSAGAHMEKL